MRLLYDVFFILFSFLYIPYLLVSRKLHRDFPQKFGFLPEDVTSLERPIWIHAVSVGEAALAARLAKALKEHHPGVPVVVSTTTMTGNDMISKRSDGAVDAHFFYPVDISFVLSRVLRKLDPRAYVMIETELWPNLLAALKRRDVPVMMANGRISDNSFKNYKWIKPITKKILSCINRFCMQSDKDAERIIALGASADKVSVTGNMKFDTSVPSSGAFTRDDLGLSDNAAVLIAGSTHFPEEQMTIDMFCELKEVLPELKFILAPRHVERSDAIKIYLDRSGLKSIKFSEMLSSTGGSVDREYDVLLVDTIGHIKDIYEVADVVFIGGSLVDKGGQNPIEAAMWGNPILFGPYTHNFREISEIFEDGGAAFRVEDITSLQAKIKELLTDKKTCLRMGKRSSEIIEKNSGAVGRTLDAIEEFLNKA